jgi:hypothetical protein
MRKWKDPLEEAEERREREKQRQERGATSEGGGPDRDHYDRPSWSEIDKKREKGGSGGGARREGSGGGDGMASLGLVSRRNPAAQKNYRAMLDKAFTGGNLGAMVGKEGLKPLVPVDDAAAQLRKKILEAIGGEQATEAVRAYVAAGKKLPDDDLDVLGAAAQASDETLLGGVLELLVALARRRPVKRVAALRQRAKFLADQAKDDRVKALSVELLGLLPAL